MHITWKAYEARLPAISFHSMLTLSLYPYIMDYTFINAHSPRLWC